VKETWETILGPTPTQVNAPWVLPPKADPPLAETQLLTEATPKPNESQAHPWLFFFALFAFVPPLLPHRAELSP